MLQYRGGVPPMLQYRGGVSSMLQYKGGVSSMLQYRGGVSSMLQYRSGVSWYAWLHILTMCKGYIVILFQFPTKVEYIRGIVCVIDRL